MFFDIRTLSFLTMASSLLLALAMHLLRRIVGAKPSVTFWARGATLTAIGMLLVGLRGVLPDLLSIVLGNTLANVGGVWLYFGLRFALGRDQGIRWDIPLGLFIALSFAYFTYIEPSLQSRLLITSLALSLMNLLTVQLTLLGREARRDTNHLAFRLLGMIALAGVLAGLARAAMLPLHPDTQDFMALGQPVIAAGLLMVIITNILLTFILVYVEGSRTSRNLLHSQEHFRSLVEQAADGIFLLNEAGQIRTANRAGAAMLGYPVPELLGRDFANAVIEDELERLRREWAALGPGQVSRSQWHMKRKDGSPFAGEIASRRLSSGRHMVVLRDVSERVRAEEASRKLNTDLEERTNQLEKRNAELREELSKRLQVGTGLALSTDALDHAREPLFVLDAAKTIILANDAFFELTGRSREETLGRQPGFFHVGANAAAFCERVWQQLASQQHWQGLFPAVSAEGKPAIRWLSLFAVTGEDGSASNYIGVLSDTSERKGAEVIIRTLNDSLEHRVRQRTIELEEANRKLESFSYSISHDLRAPLRAVHGFASIIKESASERLTEEERGYFGRIMVNANRMGELIDDILEFSRVGRAQMNMVEVDLETLAHDEAGQLGTQYPRTVIQIGALPRVRGDATLLRQAVQNLLANAFKFSSKRDHPLVEISCEEGTETSVIRVKDNGVGFDMAYASRLFNVFERMHPKTDFPGTGVGLAIVKNVVERHKGRIWAEAAPNAGASFYISLPRPASEA